MKCPCYLGILKEGFSPYSSPVMLISQKLAQDKRGVTDFRHLNIRIAKNNLAYPLVRDTFSVLDNSKCEVLLVLDLKDAFHSLRLLEEAKKDCVVYYHILEVQDKRVCVKPLRNRIEAILKLEPPKMPNGCRSFAGMVIFKYVLSQIAKIT